MADIGTAIQNVGMVAVAAGSFLAVGNKIASLIWGPRKLHKECIRHHEMFNNHIKEQHKKDTDRHKTIMTVQNQMTAFEDRLNGIDSKFNSQAVEIGKITTSQKYMEGLIDKIANKLNCV